MAFLVHFVTTVKKVIWLGFFHCEFAFDDEDIEKTAFNTRLGAFEWVVMPFDVCNAILAFQRAGNDVVKSCFEIFVRVYIDDTLILFKNAQEHQQHLDLLHDLLQQPELFPCIDKPIAFKPQVPFCGDIINKDGVQRRSMSFEVGLLRPPSMKFDNLSVSVDSIGNLSKDTRL